MNNRQPLKYSFAASQAGATLIVVLIMVLFLAIIGTIAVRNSQVGLDMTTSAQVNQLLRQSSDIPLAKLEMSGIEPGADKMTQLQNMDRDNKGPIELLQVEGMENTEYVLCYQPTVRDSLYKKDAHRVLMSADGTTTYADGNESGYCQLSKDNAYTSSRGAVASQVAITRPTVNNNPADDIEVPPLEALSLGSDQPKSVYLRAYVTSVLPALAISSTPSDIEKCLKLPIGSLAKDTVADNQILCLDETDTPMNVQVQDFAYVERAE